MCRSVPGLRLQFSAYSRRRPGGAPGGAERMPQSRWVWLERREQRLPVWPIGPRSAAVNLAASVWRMDYSTPPLRPVTSHRYAFGGLTHEAPGGDLLYSA